MPLPQSINSCWFDSQSLWMGLHVVRVSARVFFWFSLTVQQHAGLL